MPRGKKSRLKREKVIRVESSTRLTARGIETVVPIDDGGYRAGGLPPAREYASLPLVGKERIPDDARGVVVRRERQGFRFPREGIVVSVWGKKSLRAALTALRWVKWARCPRESEIVERAEKRERRAARTMREECAVSASLCGAARGIEYLVTVSLRSRKRGVTKDQIDNLILKMSEVGARVYFPVSQPGSNSSAHRSITGHVQPTARQLANWRAACALADYVGLARPERPGTRLRRREYVVFATGDDFVRETFIEAPMRRADAAREAADTRRRNSAPENPNRTREETARRVAQDAQEREASFANRRADGTGVESTRPPAYPSLEALAYDAHPMALEVLRLRLKEDAARLARREVTPDQE